MNIRHTTTDSFPDAEITDILGVVRGNSVRAKHVGKDIMASLRTIIGGEIKEYQDVINEARDIALERINQEAEALGADAIVNIRFATSQVMSGAAELLVYGTAVKLK